MLSTSRITVVPSGSQFFSSTHSDRGCSLPIELDILLQAQRITVESGCFGMLIGISLARIPQWQLMTVSLGDMMRYLSNLSFSPRPNSLESNKDLQLPQTILGSGEILGETSSRIVQPSALLCHI